jgi:novel protein kinase C epsilon type
MGVKKRKFHVVNGHKLTLIQFYQILKCAYCNEYLGTGSGYQCEACRYLCHKKCAEKVVIKCPSRSPDTEEKNLLKHNVPHKFEHSSSLVPLWCCHCGYILPVGKKGLEKCQVCTISCHTDCQVYVPNYCGMTMEMANKMMAQALEIERKKRSQPPKPKKERSSIGITISQLVQKKKMSLDDFHFVSVLGKGNFGKVMLAEEKTTGNLFAIKVLKKDFIIENDEVESIKSEKRVFITVNRERHPFLVALHSCFQSDSRIYFVMDYVSGGDLMLHIQRQQFSDARARYYACEVLLALEYFHKNDIIYRDLKLDNILLTLEGHIKIADYGLCKEDLPFGAGTTTFCGTPEFMAPEVSITHLI